MTLESTPTTEAVGDQALAFVREEVARRGLDDPTPQADAPAILGDPIPPVDAVDVDEPAAPLTVDDVARLFDVPAELLAEPAEPDDEVALEALTEAVPAVEVVIDRQDVVVTCRWYDAWSAPTSAEMAQLLQQVAARDPELGRFVTGLRGALVEAARDDDAQRRELRDAALRWDVMVRDMSRCRFCGVKVAFGTDKTEFGGLPHGTLVHERPAIAAGAANIVVACDGCGESQRRLHSEGQPGLILLPCPSRPEHTVGAAAPGDGPPAGSVAPEVHVCSTCKAETVIGGEHRVGIKHLDVCPDRHLNEFYEPETTAVAPEPAAQAPAPPPAPVGFRVPASGGLIARP